MQNVHIYPFTENIELRTTQESIQFAKEACLIKKDVFGIKGPNELSKIIYNYIETTAIDVMHCVYVGITKKLGHLWFDSDNHDCPFYLTKFLSVINRRIEKICPPNFVQRLPRSISDIAYWKASELKFFLLIYSLPLLYDIMPEQYFNHHKLLVHAIYLLNQNSISNQMIDKAELYLKEYVSRFSDLYREIHMSCNLHLLLHLPEIVRRFGPLWVTSCFPFENMNGIIKSFVHGTRYSELQIYSSIMLLLNYSEIKKKYLVPESIVSHYCEILESKSRLKAQKISEKISIVGKIIKPSNLSDTILYCFRNINFIEENVRLFHRILINNLFIDCVAYGRKRKTKSSVIEYIKDEVSYIGRIEIFVKMCNCNCEEQCDNCQQNCQTYAIVNKYHTQEAFYCAFSTSFSPHIYLCTVNENSLTAVPVNNIRQVLFQLDMENSIYVIAPVNTIETE